MKNKNQTTSPELRLEITKENYERAVMAKSGSCLVADAIKQQYPRFSNLSVDAATVRFTDKKQAERYIYITPPSVWEVLLFFDQGWREKNLPKKLRLRNAVKIIPITRSASSIKASAERRIIRLKELEEKEREGQSLTGFEQRSLAKLRNPKKLVKRPASYGPMKAGEPIKYQDMGGEESVVIRGGKPMRHANLLHSLNRHFGARKAQPSAILKEAIDEAVKEAVKADRAKRKRRK